jgi:cyclopropane-fatty-acyl-phospholipid synthase
MSVEVLPMSASVSSGSARLSGPPEDQGVPRRSEFGLGAAIRQVASVAAAEGSLPGRVSGADRWLTRRLLQAIGNPPIHIVLWDGQEIRGADSPPITRVIVRNRRTLLRLVANPGLNFGDDYTAGRIDVEGDLLGLLEAVYRAEKPPDRLHEAVGRWIHRARSNTVSGSRKNIHHHYDIGNDFYKLWLDKEMLYTCAYFPKPAATLEEAQLAKMDLVCRKLWLRPGETVVETGCGWGALAIYMAKHFGVSVKAYNVSHEQIRFARGRAKAEGLQDRVQFIEDDYRNLAERFDVFVSVGMLEHVGPDHYRELGGVIDRSLNPTGRGLLHSIGRDWPDRINAWIERRIFPGAHPPSLREMLEVLEPSGLSVLDVENLRLHYAETLTHWLTRFDAAVETVAKMFDKPFVRAWRLYLMGSLAAFTTGTLQLFQVLFARHGVNEIPWNRQRLLAGDVEREA